MRHPKIENKSGLKFDVLPLADKDGRPLLVCVVKGTFEIGRSGLLSVSEKQVGLNFAGEYWADPEKSSCKYEPECALLKPSTDVVLIGSAYAPKPQTMEVQVSLRAGTLEKSIRVVGDRFWVKTLGLVGPTEPRPFERIPLRYERAFGGWDRSNPNPQKHAFDPRNPVGVGFRSKNGRFHEGVPLPNLEDPRHPIRGYGSIVPPAGFGFTAPHWEPRAKFGGTYDKKWTDERMPLLPLDFDYRYFNGASEGLIARGYFRGDESVLVENASPERRLSFRLPGLPPPRIAVELRGAEHKDVETQLDTVIINADERLLFLLWRGNVPLKRGFEDVAAIVVPTRSDSTGRSGK
jgi:hypothetical protein